MAEKIRGHIRSNVIGYVALFIALGGTAWANHETIFSDDIVDGEVKSVDINNGGVRTFDIRDNDVQGLDILDSTVASVDIQNGQVRSGDVADENLTGTDINEASLGFECPGGYELAGKDVCYEPAPPSAGHAQANFDTALSTCAGNGDRLPTLAEGYAVIADLPNPAEFDIRQTWTADQSSGSTQATALTKNFQGTITRSSFATSSTISYRCVTSPHG
jgi:hypothetical protein